MRGSKAEVGAERTSPNGYRYVKCEGGWRLKHHLVAEKKLGRSITAEERVVFLDGDKTNFKPNNIDVREKGKSSIRRRKAYLEDRIREMEDELDEINAQLEI